MAEKEEQDELDLGGEKGSKKKLIIIIGGVLVLLLAVSATLYFLGVFSSDESGTGEATTEETDVEVPPPPAIYFDLKPDFIVNFPKPGIRLLQVSISVMSRQQESIDVVTKHLPRIRNNLLLIMADENPEKLRTAKGKEALRKKLLAETQKIVEEETADKEGLEGLFFTGFVMQ